ncbi:MAG: hypothetical protein GY898_06620 [Proteobacteria bacterium]|nr:hypothetical protein [Pseudomonadota bacterium]
MRSALLLAAALLLIGCPTNPEERAVSPVQLHFDTDLRDGFWSMPWPHDLRTVPARRAGGRHPDLWGFPNPSASPILGDYVLFGSTVIEGFGLNSPTYFWFDGPVAIPAWDRSGARASMRCEGPIRIVNIDSTSDEFGECLPARWEYVEDAGSDPWLEDNLLMVAPYWGFPLDSATTYAVYVIDAQDPQGRYLRPSADVQEALESDLYAPLMDHLEQTVPLPADEIEDQPPWWWVSAATVFTTQDVLQEMRVLSDFVREEPTYPAWNDDEGLTLLDEDHPEHQSQYDLYDGSYTAWNFQEGDIPYVSEGGGFVWDENGRPVPQAAERIPFVIGTPLASADQPEEGWPVILHAHGTGGDRFSHLGGGQLRPGLQGAARGFVSIGIPQPFHGDRWPGGNDGAISLYSFNYFNPESGVSTFRQGALDTIALVRFVQENLAAGGALAEAHPDLRIDPECIYFLGHSQGGLTGGLAMPFTEGVKGWVLSGSGGGLSMTIMQREDPFIIRDVLLSGIGAPEGTTLFEMHPIVGMVQSLAELTDPINYAPYWIAKSERGPSSLLLTEGMHDIQTPADTSEALATSGRLGVVRPFEERDVFGLELRGLESIREPYSGNFEHPSGVNVTTGVAQFDTDHFAIFTNADASQLWANFFYSMAQEGPPGELGASFP